MILVSMKYNVYYLTIIKFKTAVLARNEIRVYSTMHDDDNFHKNKSVNMNYGSKKDSLMQLNIYF